MKHTPTIPRTPQHEDLLSTASDVGKDLFGFRPRWISGMGYQELKETVARRN